MSAIKLEPYIFFKGNCREAMNFYKDVFGGELMVQTYAEVKMGEAHQQDWLMHAKLEGDVVIMGSDTDRAGDKAAKVSLSLGGDDEAKLRPIFEALSDGGSVFQPLEKQFWGDIFGSLTDKYGVEWMMNIAQPAQD